LLLLRLVFLNPIQRKAQLEMSFLFDQRAVSLSQN